MLHSLSSFVMFYITYLEYRARNNILNVEVN
jgi:hypothetical protein